MQRDFFIVQIQTKMETKKLHYETAVEFLFVINKMYYILLILSIKALPLASSS
jgi:hypothetical protein